MCSEISHRYAHTRQPVAERQLAVPWDANPQKARQAHKSGQDMPNAPPGGVNAQTVTSATSQYSFLQEHFTAKAGNSPFQRKEVDLLILRVKFCPQLRAKQPKIITKNRTFVNLKCKSINLIMSANIKHNHQYISIVFFKNNPHITSHGERTFSLQSSF